MTVHTRDTLCHTYADYLAWSRSSGDELIDGVSYVKEPPAPSPIHQGIVAELCRQAGNALEDSLARVFVGPFDVRLPRSNEQGDEVCVSRLILFGSYLTEKCQINDVDVSVVLTRKEQ